jgi:hypothetical protein
MIIVESLETRTLLSSWYVSLKGHDTNPGTAARPFATIQQAANRAKPGDTVFIKAGVYHQAVVPPTSGTAQKPITFRPMGHANVVIDGADLVGGLTQASPGIYTSTTSGDLGDGNNQFFINGVSLNEAQWPNTGTNTASSIALPTMATVASATVDPTVNGIATATISVPSLTDATGAWVGATIHIAPGQAWVFQTGTVIASSPGSLTYTYVPLEPYGSQMPQTGNPFYLTGSMQAFNDGGQWYYDSDMGQFSLRVSGATVPAVEMKQRLYAFDLSGDSYIHIQNIKLTGCTINTDANSSNIVLNNLNANYVSAATNEPNPWDDQNHPHTTGIILNGTNNLIENSIVAFSSGDGVFLGGSFNTVENCIIHDVDTDGADEGGVTSLGSNNNILKNTIYNCSRSGVIIRHSPQISVLHNRIYSCGLQTTDVGGIYAFGTDGQESRIAYNVISDIRTGGFGGVGLYIDNGSSNYILDHNVTWNVDAAAKINPPESGIQVYNNTFIGVSFSVATSGDPTDAGDVFTNNILIGPSQMGDVSQQSKNLMDPTGAIFVNAAINNYQLAKKSVAIDAGAVVPGYTDGYKGKAPDVGAYESKTKPFVAGATARFRKAG